MRRQTRHKLYLAFILCFLSIVVHVMFNVLKAESKHRRIPGLIPSLFKLETDVIGTTEANYDQEPRIVMTLNNRVMTGDRKQKLEMKPPHHEEKNDRKEKTDVKLPDHEVKNDRNEKPGVTLPDHEVKNNRYEKPGVKLPDHEVKNDRNEKPDVKLPDHEVKNDINEKPGVKLPDHEVKNDRNAKVFEATHEENRNKATTKDMTKDSRIPNLKHYATAQSRKARKVPARLQKAQWHDQELIKHVRQFWIIPTNPEWTSGKYTSLGDVSQIGQSKIIDRLLKERYNGFYVECGVADGVHFSDTLYLEEHRNWTGLLIEADPTAFAKLVTSGRRGYMVNACLSPTSSATVQQFTVVMNTTLGGLTRFIDESHMANLKATNTPTYVISMQCFPLATILLAIGVAKVDFLSLDVEGSELGILKSVPYKTISIDTMTVEYHVIGDRVASEMKLNKIRSFMLSNDRGYQEVQTIAGLDIILQKKPDGNR